VSSPPDPLATSDDLARFGLPQEALDALELRAPGAGARGLAAGTAMALGYLSGRYTLPLVSWDDAVRANVCYWVAAQLLTTLGAHPDNPADQAILDRATAAVAWFRDVARGLASPAIVDSAPAADAASADQTFCVTNPRRHWIR